MRGVWLEEQSLSYRDDVPKPTSKPSEAIIKPILVGICSTDLELIKGYYPYRGVLGHEFVGEVVSSVEKPDLVGKRVVGEINAVCHDCKPCKSENATHCENRTTLGIVNRDGVFADYFQLPTENLLIVDDAIPDNAAVFVEPIAAAMEILEQVQIKPTDKVLLIGAGRLGMLIARVVQLTGANLEVVVRNDKQIYHLQRMGINTIFEKDIISRQSDVCIEVTGSPAGYQMAVDAVRARGTIILKSTYAGTMDVDFSTLVVNEIQVVGSRCGPFQPALELLKQGLIDPTPLIDGVYPLADYKNAFEHAQGKGVYKILLVL